MKRWLSLVMLAAFLCAGLPAQAATLAEPSLLAEGIGHLEAARETLAGMAAEDFGPAGAEEYAPAAERFAAMLDKALEGLLSKQALQSENDAHYGAYVAFFYSGLLGLPERLAYEAATLAAPDNAAAADAARSAYLEFFTLAQEKPGETQAEEVAPEGETADDGSETDPAKIAEALTGQALPEDALVVTPDTPIGALGMLIASVAKVDPTLGGGDALSQEEQEAWSEVHRAMNAALAVVGASESPASTGGQETEKEETPAEAREDAEETDAEAAGEADSHIAASLPISREVVDPELDAIYRAALAALRAAIQENRREDQALESARQAAAAVIDGVTARAMESGALAASEENNGLFEEVREAVSQNAAFAARAYVAETTLDADLGAKVRYEKRDLRVLGTEDVIVLSVGDGEALVVRVTDAGVSAILGEVRNLRASEQSAVALIGGGQDYVATENRTVVLAMDCDTSRITAGGRSMVVLAGETETGRIFLDNAAALYVHPDATVERVFSRDQAALFYDEATALQVTEGYK